MFCDFSSGQLITRVIYFRLEKNKNQLRTNARRNYKTERERESNGLLRPGAR